MPKSNFQCIIVYIYIPKYVLLLLWMSIFLHKRYSQQKVHLAVAK